MTVLVVLVVALLLRPLKKYLWWWWWWWFWWWWRYLTGALCGRGSVPSGRHATTRPVRLHTHPRPRRRAEEGQGERGMPACTVDGRRWRLLRPVVRTRWRTRCLPRRWHGLGVYSHVSGSGVRTTRGRRGHWKRRLVAVPSGVASYGALGHVPLINFQQFQFLFTLE